MDTNKCKALLKVLETGNLSEAAEELGYTPSGISRMMSSLEEETGFALLARSHTGVKATTACEAMLPTIKEVVRVGEHYAQEASELMGGAKGEVRIGTAYAKFYQPLSDIIGKFSERYPGIRISIREGRSLVLMNEVEEQNLDFCIISKREGNAERPINCCSSKRIHIFSCMKGRIRTVSVFSGSMESIRQFVIQHRTFRQRTLWWKRALA